MAETNAQRITQLESIVNELTVRVAADSTNMDLPPLLAAAQVELTDLRTAGVTAAVAAAAAANKAAADKSAADKVAADKSAADKVAADKAAADKAAADKAATDAVAAGRSRRAAAADAAAAAAAAAAVAPATAPAPAMPTVPESMKADTRPNPGAPRPTPVAGSSRSGQ
jgi:hypothetical protein